MRYRFLFTILLVVFFLNSNAQNNKKKYLDSAEIAPEFIGGVDSMNIFLTKNIIYPPLDLSKGISGVVLVKFAIDTVGNITEVRVVKSVSFGIDKEAIRVTNLMPKWKPGLQFGKRVKVYYTLPITFSANEIF